MPIMEKAGGGKGFSSSSNVLVDHLTQEISPKRLG